MDCTRDHTRAFGVFALGAISHQVVSVWAPVRVGAPLISWHDYVPSVGKLRQRRHRALPRHGGDGQHSYTNYRITARLTLETGHYWKSVGSFELKEHLIAIGLALLPAYWYFWRPSSDAGDARTRTALTTLLAFIVWWTFLAGHVANNIRASAHEIALVAAGSRFGCQLRCGLFGGLLFRRRP